MLLARGVTLSAVHCTYNAHALNCLCKELMHSMLLISMLDVQACAHKEAESSSMMQHHKQNIHFVVIKLRSLLCLGYDVPVMLDGRDTTFSWNSGRFWKMTQGGLMGQAQRCRPPSSIPTGALFCAHACVKSIMEKYCWRKHINWKDEPNL